MSSTSSPSSLMLPDQRVRCSGWSCRIERRVTLLPEPDSPRMPSVSPRFDVEADAVHRMHGAVGRHEGDVQVADLEKVCLMSGPSRLRMAASPPTRMWQATSCAPVSASSGSTPAQTSSAKGQRVRKRQPDGGSIGIGRIALDRRLLGAPARIHRRPRRQQRARVGMLRIAVDRLDRADLDDLAEIHHQHAVAEILHDVEVVADEEVGEAELGP